MLTKQPCAHGECISHFECMEMQLMLLANNFSIRSAASFGFNFLWVSTSAWRSNGLEEVDLMLGNPIRIE